MMLFVWLALVGIAHMLRTAISKPQPEPRPWCADCGTRFLDARGVDLHRRAAHPDTFEDRPMAPGDFYRTNGDQHGN